jgi:hypothetical protein
MICYYGMKVAVCLVLATALGTSPIFSEEPTAGALAADSESSDTGAVPRNPPPQPAPGLAPLPSNAIIAVPRIEPKTPVYRADVEDQTFNWSGAIRDSMVFLAIQHGVRVGTQEKTRREFGGKFFNDWGKSIRGIQGWGDGDNILTNYVGHPLQGGVSGYFQIHHDPKGKYLEFGNNRRYWSSRLKAMAWSAAYSTQFEIGPLSEATIGNVGKRPGTSGMVDLVVTPTWGLGFIVAEDAIDKYVIRRMERASRNSNWIRAYRTFFTPQKAFANTLRGKWPWYRDGRPVPVK